MQISKSRYCRGIQCPKMIWMDQNMPEKAIKKARKDILENGTEVGKLAQTCFEGCKEVTFSLNGKEMAEETRTLIDKGEKVIAEASFYYEDLFCSVDILRKNSDDDSYDIIEVKSSTSVSEIYAEDLAFQHYVLTNAGIKINRAYIMHINGSYERKGNLDLSRFFHMEDLTDVMEDYQKKIPDMLKVLRFALSQKAELPVPVGVYCEKPYECDYKEYCHRHITSPSVFDINCESLIRVNLASATIPPILTPETL